MNDIKNKLSLERVKIASILSVFSGFCFFAYEYILRIVPSVMVPQFTADMHINATKFGILSAYYYLAYSPLQLVVGIILDKYDVKRILTIASLLCATGTLLMTLIHSQLLFAICRFMQGVGSAFAWVGILKLAAIFLPKKFYSLAISLGSTFGFMGAAFGQMTIGTSVNNYGGSFTLLLLTIAGFLISYFIFNEISRAQQTTDNADFSTHKVNFYGWYKRALIIFKKPYFWAAGVIGALMFAPITVFGELWGVSYFSNVYSYPNIKASFIVSMIFVGIALGSVSVGILTLVISDKIKIIRYGSFGALISSIFILYVKLPFEILCFSCILFGIFCSTEGLVFAMGRDVVSKNLAGMTGAAINLCCMAAGVGFQRLFGTLLDVFWQGQRNANGLKAYPSYAYEISVLVIPIVLFSAFLFTYCISEENKRFHNISVLKNNSRKIYIKLCTVLELKRW